MKRSFLIIAALLLATRVTADTPKEQSATQIIPLDQIWGYNMPGTRNVRELEPKVDLDSFVDELALRRELSRTSDVWRILTVLSKRPKEGENAGPTFAVVGQGKEALKNVSSILSSKNKQPPSVLPAKTGLSVVFYSYQTGRYVHLAKVQQSPGLITVKYQLVRHRTQNLSTHFAIIPIGKLNEGKVRVKVELLRSIDEAGKPAPPVGDPRQFVSGSFSFTVQKR